MPKTFPIRLEVEEIALGTVLRKLHDMPGIAKLHLDLGHGGEGPGKKQLEKRAILSCKNHSKKQNYEATVVKLLHAGSEAQFGKSLRPSEATPQSRLQRDDFAAQARPLRERPATRHAPAHQRRGVALEGQRPCQRQRRCEGSGQRCGALAPPAPQLKHGPSGRPAPGSSSLVLSCCGPRFDGGQKKTPAGTACDDTRAASGLSGKGVSGVLNRGKRDGIIKKVGDTYELTAKGQKIEVEGASANG